MKHRLSFFRNAFETAPVCVALTWDRLCDQLLPHEAWPAGDVPCPRCDGAGCHVCKKTGHVPAKLTCPAWSPAMYPEHARRGKKNAECASIWGGDFDALTAEQLERLIDIVLGRGWALMVYTTYSDWSKRHIDAEGNPSEARLYRVRFLIPLSREVTPDEWPHVWQVINDTLDGLSDPKCKDISRLYFGACTPDLDEAFAHTFEGVPVDADALLDGYTPPPPSPEPTRPTDTAKETVSRARLERYARALSRKRNERDNEAGVLLRKVCNGESFAEDGSRDVTIYRLSLVLAKRFTECDPNSIARHFGPSLALMAREADECPTVDDVAYKIERAQREIIAERIQEQATDLARLQARIRDAFGTDRVDPYRPDEVPANPRWIVQKGTSFYTWVAGEYHGPYSKDEAQNAIIRDLSPATSVGVELFTTSPTGIVVPKSVSKLVRDYGFVADDVAVDLSAQVSYFDEPERTIVEAPCPLRPIEPKHYPEIEAWLAALAGPARLPFLLAWIANLTRLERPCTALFLTGPKSTGKSLGPNGWSRLWTTIGMPTPLEDVLGTNFNDAQLRCPLTFADERLPTDYKGRVLNAELRHYIQARRRPLKRKFLSNADLIGSTRLVISANNEEILATSETMSNNDIDASIERFLWVPCQHAAATVLRSVDHDRWVEDDMIAAHALWLRDNFKWKPNGRFLVHNDDRELHSRLVSGSGMRSSVLQFCVGYLLNPSRLDADARGQYLIRVNMGRLCVNTQALVACWDTYVSNERCPSTGKLAGSIAALATDERVRLTLPNGKRPNYRVIRPEHLKAWAVRTGYASEEQIVEALEVDTEERSKHLGTPQLVKGNTA